MFGSSNQKWTQKGGKIQRTMKLLWDLFFGFMAYLKSLPLVLCHEKKAAWHQLSDIALSLSSAPLIFSKVHRIPFLSVLNLQNVNWV